VKQAFFAVFTGGKGKQRAVCALQKFSAAFFIGYGTQKHTVFLES
jgi:hypothetical protein